MISIKERLKSPTEMMYTAMEAMSREIRVALPGVIQSWDSSTQTAEILISVKEKIQLDGEQEWVNLPLLVDVPLALPRAGGHLLAIAINPGDECWVWFADMCYDASWQSGGDNNVQVDRRRHDLSDAFFMPTTFSQPKRIPNYPTSGIELRSDNGSSVVSVDGGSVTVSGGSVSITGGSVSIGGSTTIDGKVFLSHSHSGVMPGGGNTGGVV